MQFQLETHGDPLERKRATVIRSRLPNYAPAWEQYIGNDGQSQLPAQATLDETAARQRETVSMYTYTALESFLCADQIAEDAEALIIEPFDHEGALTSYLDVINRLIAFFAHTGRVRDCAEKLAKEWKDPELARELDEFYGRRNNVLHSAKLPMVITNGVVEVAVPEGRELDGNKWSTNCRWEDAGHIKREDLSRLFVTTRDELAKALDRMLARLYAHHLSAKLGAVRKALQTLPDLGAGGVYPASGTTVSSFVSMSYDQKDLL